MKLKAAFATEAYVSDGGYFVIKQESPMAEDEAMVLLTPWQMRLLIKEMQTSLDDFVWDEEDQVEG